MADIFGDNSVVFTNLKTIIQKDGGHKLLSNGISSLNFDGSIPKVSTTKYVSNINPGDTLFLNDPYRSMNQVLITDVEKKTISNVDYFFLYYLSSEDINEPFTYMSTFNHVDNGITYYGYNEDDQFDVLCDDVDNVLLGNNGWSITNNGNAVFSNVFVRGRLEATDGIFDGTMTAGLDDNGKALVVIGKDIFDGQQFDPRGTVDSEIISGVEAHGLYIDPYTFLLSYNKTRSLAISSVVAANGTDVNTTNYFATITYSTASFTPSIAVGDVLYLNGMPYESLNGLKTVTAIGAGTFQVAATSDIGSSGTTALAGFAENGGFEDQLSLTSMVSSTTTTTITKSNLTVNFTLAASSDNFSIDDYVQFSSFTNVTLDPILSNKLYKVTNKGTGYVVFVSDRISAATYSTGLGTIDLVGSYAKFGVGGSTNYLNYSSETGELSVTGTINKINIGRGGGDISTNIIYGVNALKNNTTGFENIAFGVESMLNANNSSYNIAIGSQALYAATSGIYNIAIGKHALYTATGGDYNIAIGAYSLDSDTTGEYNIAIGVNTLNSITDGYRNVAIGAFAGELVTGINNVLVGSQAGDQMTTGDNNVALGAAALYSNTGSNNIALGTNALYNSKGSNNISIGSASLQTTTTGNNNVALGFESLTSNITSDYSVAIGYRALKLSTGTQNLAIGYGAGNAITTGGKNVVIGGNSGSSIATSSNRLIVSDGDGTVFFTGDNLQNITIPTGNLIASVGRIGYDFNASTSSTTQRAFIDPTGGFLWAAKASNTALYLQRTGSLGSIAEFYNDTTRAGYINITGASALAYVATSDYRIKENVTPIKNAISDLLKLKPVTYYFTTENNGQLQQGFLAHELQEIVPTAAFGEKDEIDIYGNPIYQGTDVAKIVPLLTAALQESIEKIEDLEKRIALLEDK